MDIRFDNAERSIFKLIFYVHENNGFYVFECFSEQTFNKCRLKSYNYYTLWLPSFHWNCFLKYKNIMLYNF